MWCILQVAMVDLVAVVVILSKEATELRLDTATLSKATGLLAGTCHNPRQDTVVTLSKGTVDMPRLNRAPSR
jgi:hypothetical protein